MEWLAAFQMYSLMGEMPVPYSSAGNEKQMYRLPLMMEKRVYFAGQRICHEVTKEIF